MKAMFAAAFLASTIMATSAFAAEPPPCAGKYEYVRTDAIKPGQMALFLKAVHDHQAWYASHGLPDKIRLGRVVDPQTGAVSETQAVTAHTDGQGEGAAPHSANDAAWNAYVQEYKASSTVTNAALVCFTAAP